MTKCIEMVILMLPKYAHTVPNLFSNVGRVGLVVGDNAPPLGSWQQQQRQSVPESMGNLWNLVP